MNNATLRGVWLGQADLSGAWLVGTNLADSRLYDANLSGATLRATILRGAVLQQANLTRAMAMDADFSGAWLPHAKLMGTGLQRARFDGDTVLAHASLDDRTRLADVRWNGVPVTQVEWQHLSRIGDEFIARLSKRLGKPADAIQPFEEAARAYRLLAITLRSQGLNELADRYAYCAQLMQRVVLRRQRHYLRWLGSLFLWLIAGYGYRPLRSFATYLVVVTVFGLAYWALGVQTRHTLTWNEAGILTLSRFKAGDAQATLGPPAHGRA